MDPVVASSLMATALPAAVAAVVALAACCPWTSPPRRGRAEAGIALAFAAAIAATALALRGWPGVIPRSPDRWVLHVAALGLLLGLVSAAGRPPTPVRLLLFAPGVLLAAFAATYVKVLRQWAPQESAAWLVGLTAAMAVFWAALDMLARRARGPVLPLLLWMTFAGVSAALLLAAESWLSMLAASVSAASAVLALLAWGWPDRASAAGALPVVTLAGTLLLGVAASKRESPLPIPAASLLVIAAPLGAWVHSLPPVARLRPVLGAGVACAVSAAGVAGAVAIAWARSVP